MVSYRDYLARRGYQPLKIERTEKAAGDIVLSSWCRPAEQVPAWVRQRDERGKFIGSGTVHSRGVKAAS